MLLKEITQTKLYFQACQQTFCNIVTWYLRGRILCWQIFLKSCNIRWLPLTLSLCSSPYSALAPYDIGTVRHVWTFPYPRLLGLLFFFFLVDSNDNNCLKVCDNLDENVDLYVFNEVVIVFIQFSRLITHQAKNTMKSDLKNIIWAWVYSFQ